MLRPITWADLDSAAALMTVQHHGSVHAPGASEFGWRVINALGAAFGVPMRDRERAYSAFIARQIADTLGKPAA